MSSFHLVRVGALGRVGRFAAPDGRVRRRGKRVVVRTERGLELGEVLAPPRESPRPYEAESHDAHDAQPMTSAGPELDGELLRAMTPADELLEKRLEARTNAAFERCSNAVAERGLPVTLIDVEHLFDGRGLYFYFLGAEVAERESAAEWERLVRELAAEYEAVVQFQKFAEAVEQGCGPDCGTKACGTSDAGAGEGGSGCGNCATQGCAIKSARPAPVAAGTGAGKKKSES